MESTGSIPITNRQAHSPDKNIKSNQVILFKKEIIRFIKKSTTIREVLFRKKNINN